MKTFSVLAGIFTLCCSALSAPVPETSALGESRGQIGAMGTGKITGAVESAPAVIAEITVPAQGEKVSFDLGLSLDYLVGYSNYEIKGIDGTTPFKSRLEWPLRTLFAGPAIKLTFHDEFVLSLSYRTNVTDDPGKLKDYDWLFGEKSALGEIDTDLTAHLVDCNFIWDCVRKERFTLGLGAGYGYEYLYWEADGTLMQTYYNWYFGYPPGTFDEGNAKWITYKINYHLPYLIVDSRYCFNQLFSIRAFGKLTAVIANDRDDHVQRLKLATSDYAGIGLAVGGEGRFDFQPNSYGALTVGLTYLAAEGDQDQRFYDGSGWEMKGIDAKTESLQARIGARVGLLF